MEYKRKTLVVKVQDENEAISIAKQQLKDENKKNITIISTNQIKLKDIKYYNVDVSYYQKIYNEIFEESLIKVNNLTKILDQIIVIPKDNLNNLKSVLLNKLFLINETRKYYFVSSDDAIKSIETLLFKSENFINKIEKSQTLDDYLSQEKDYIDSLKKTEIEKYVELRNNVDKNIAKLQKNKYIGEYNEFLYCYLFAIKYNFENTHNQLLNKKINTKKSIESLEKYLEQLEDINFEKINNKKIKKHLKSLIKN